MTISAWTPEWLEEQGFEGFMSFEDLKPVAPQAPGVYVVIRIGNDSPGFLAESSAAWQEGKNPAVVVPVLAAAWVTSSSVMYIGKATNLRSRLGQYRRHGAGTNSGHWGGRYIWQLADHADLVVAWLATPERDPEVVEAELIERFVKDHSTLPFANRKLGSRQRD